MPANSEKLKKATEMRRLWTEATERGLTHDIPALAYEATFVPGFDPDSDEALYGRSVLISPRPHPLLEALLETRGATRTGALTWAIWFGENYNDAALRALLTHTRTSLIWAESQMATGKGPRDLSQFNGHSSKYGTIATQATGTPAEHVIRQLVPAALRNPHPAGADGFGAIGLSFSARAVYIKVFTHQVELPGDVPAVQLGVRPAGENGARDAKPAVGTHAVAALEALAAAGVTVVDPDPSGPIARLRRRVASSVVAYPTVGKPAMAEVSVGRQVRSLIDLGTPAPGEGQAASRGTVPAEAVEAALRAAPAVTGAIHPGTRDAGRLTLAEPFEDPRLRSYQKLAVGRHLATDIGYLNACSPGMGKTVMCLSGMRERAKDITGYRGLIVVEANVRHQWGPEAAKWFPDAQVVTIRGSKDVANVAKTLREAGEKPVVVISSYAMLATVTNEIAARKERPEAVEVLAPIDGRTIGAAATERTQTPPEEVSEAPVTDTPTQATVTQDAPAPAEEPDDQLALFTLDDDVTDAAATVYLVEEPADGTAAAEDVEEPEPVGLGKLFLDTYWHDLIADEAEVLRSSGSKQAAALWHLRENAGVAVALTGTPVNRGIDDLGRLISWVRADAHLFYGVKLSTQFDLTDEDDLERLREAMGGVLFRADTSEVSDEVPTVTPVIMKLRPTAAEKALADAARMELKRVYDELLEALTMAEELDPENPEFGEARDALRAARGAHLGGTTLARMASSDPAALIGSTSAGAALLSGQGLVAAATQATGTKRAAVVEYTLDRIAEGQAVLIFTEFATVATGLIADLEAAGARVGQVLGGGGTKRDRMIEEFKDGHLDVMVCTSSGERGLNLQRASVIVHYDLPWAPKGVLQRTGRALRLESKNKNLTLVFPLMEGTVEERVAATVVRRALEAMYALDKSRGVDISKTEIGIALGGLAGAVTDTAEGRSHGNELMEITRQLVG